MEEKFFIKRPSRSGGSSSKYLMDKKEFVVSTSPHVFSDISIKQIMFSVLGALAPAALVSVYFFGMSAFSVLLLSVAGAIGFEAFIQYKRGIKPTVLDGSAAVAGLLLALNLPAGSPWWLALLGAFIVIAVKQVYGGLGYNPFNPALVARVVLLISFPVQMTRWISPTPLFLKVNAISAATPLGELQMARIMKKTVADVTPVGLWDSITGNMAGSLGEVSALALLVGAAYLLYKGIIAWYVPVSMIGTVVLLTGICWVIDPIHYASPVVHVFSGGLILGAFFMATDMVTIPVTTKGLLIFGFGCGLITAVIRLWGGYPEGVSFAILLMNSIVPIIDKYTKPVTFGYVASADE